MFPVCPKCRHRLPAPSGATSCPACGLMFEKYVAARRGEPAREPPSTSAEDDRDETPLGLLLAVPERVESWRVWARAALFAALALWGWRIAAMDIRTGEIMSSFIHGPHLVFHEAGHVIFRAFGSVMHVAGGTIGQLAMPAIVGVALLRRNRDAFGASIALWWLATSFMDCAPYAWDARDPQLMLLSGRTGEAGGHDWIEMLGRLGLLEHSHAVGRAFHLTGVALMAVANVWSAAVLWRQYRNRTEAAVLD